jgi:hypothetical protein
MSFADVHEFIVSKVEDRHDVTRSGAGAGAGGGAGAVPALLVLAGMVECLARAPVSSAEEVIGMIRDAGCGGVTVRIQVWLLGRLEGVGFRLRDEVRVYEAGAYTRSVFSST